MGTSAKRPPHGQSWEPVGAAVMLLALTVVTFTGPFQALASDQRAAHGLAFAAAAFAFALSLSRSLCGPVCGVEQVAGATLLVANLAVVWLLVDHFHGDLLATVAAGAVPQRDLGGRRPPGRVDRTRRGVPGEIGEGSVARPRCPLADR